MGEAAGASQRAPDGRRLRWTEHRTQRRAAFVSAGVAAVDEHGPDANAEQIAEAAGVSRTVLYRYFRDREDLRTAIADHVVTAVVDSVLPHIAIGPAATPRSIITSAVEVIIGWFDEHPNLYYFLRSRRTGPGLESVENTLADRVSQLLKLALVLFGLDDQQAEPGAYGIVGMVESIGSWWLAKRTMSRARITAVVCEAIWNLLDGTARSNGIILGYDEPLPWTRVGTGAGT
ncbi:MAG: TetR/AcrR family transcriptional regulator [Jatrophihabitantaceae bacterium]